MAANGQDQAAPASEIPVIRSDVRQVLVPFLVLDQHGRRVPGLKASDFQVFEDGIPERIVAFNTDNASSESPDRSTAGGTAVNSDSPKATNPAVTPKRTYLIIVDTLHSSFGNFGRVRDALGKFLDHEHTTDSQYALVALGRQLQVVQDSTSDLDVLTTAVRSSGFAKLIKDSETSNAATTAEQFIALVQGDYCNLCGGCRGFGERDLQGCAGARSRVQGFLNSFSSTSLMINLEFFRNLQELVRVTATMPTSHTIVFISDGFNRFPGRELYSILHDGYGVRDRNIQFSPQDTQLQMDGILKLATKYDVKFYTLDSRGLYSNASILGGGFSATASLPQPEAVDSQARSVAHENTDAMAQLARETGGLFFENSNDLLKGLRQAVADGREYYVLSYVPENKVATGTYRKIVVVANNAKWRIIAKTGYWATEN